MKKAIIVGGTSGIGYGVAKMLVANNYKVIATGVRKDKVTKLQLLNQKNITIKHLDCLTEGPSEEIRKFVEILGGLDLLIFSAGIGNLNKDLGYEVENNANKVNVLAFTEIANWSYKFFENQSHGHFVAITSISGLIGYREAPAYHAAKAYQINYLEGLKQRAYKARKKKQLIYVTDIRPGFVKTRMTKGKKTFWLASQEEAANQIFQLMKKKKTCGYITGRWKIVALLIKLLPTWLRTRL